LPAFHLPQQFFLNKKKIKKWTKMNGKLYLNQFFSFLNIFYFLFIFYINLNFIQFILIYHFFTFIIFQFFQYCTNLLLNFLY
jgi:hypothetical protein